MPEPMLHARDFGYSYPGAGAPALDAIDLVVEAGQFVLLAGASGSGKSTLLRAGAALVPHFHGGSVAGELTVCGLDVRDNGPGEIAAVAGSLVQDPESQVVMGGVRAEIGLGLEHRGRSRAEVARGVEEASLALGIAGLLERRTDTLSGGELQRVALAAAIAHRPRLLLLDEPTAQLDPVAGDELIWLLRRLNEEWGTTILLAEHRLERCLGAVDRVVGMAAGRIVADAAPAAFLDWATNTDTDVFITPIARMFSLAGIHPLPTSVKEARQRLEAGGAVCPTDDGRRQDDIEGAATVSLSAVAEGTLAIKRQLSRRPSGTRGRRSEPAVRLHGVWAELEDGPAILRGIDLELEPGERVALMGRNGAGKSTLFRHIQGLDEPTRGRVERAGRVALLMQSPGDYLVHDRVADEVGADGVSAAGLSGRESDNPRDLSGGQRQRLALEVVLAAGVEPPVAVLLDEPTRGMDAVWKHGLAARLRELAAGGAMVVVATHDTAFAADFADRVVLMGAGVVIADAPASEVLAGGWHFATEVARVLGGAGGALGPAEGARLILRAAVEA